MTEHQAATPGPSDIPPARRWPWLSVLLALILLACHGWQLHQAEALGLSGSALMTELGANVAPLSATGDYWRLPASLFLHQSWEHLLQNLLVLLAVGLALEAILSRWALLAIFTAGGIFAAWVSAFVHFDYTVQTLLGGARQVIYVSTGASGAILSLTGAALVLALAAQWNGRASAHTRSLMRSALFVSVLTLGYGMVDTSIDNTAHIAGFGFGLLAGMVIAVSQYAPRPALLLGSGLLALGVTGLIAWTGYQGIRQNPSAQDLRRITLDMQSEATRSRDHKRLLAAEQNELPPAASAETARGLVIQEPFVGGVYTAGSADRLHLLKNYDESEAKEFDLSAGRVVSTWVRHSYPDGMTWGCPHDSCFGVGVADLHVDARQAYVANLVKGAVSRVDMASGKVLFSTPTGPFPSRLLVHGNVIYAYDWAAATLTLLDARNGKVLQTLALDDEKDARYRWPHGDTLALSQDQTRLYLLSPYGRVHVYDLAARTLTPWALPTGSSSPYWRVLGIDPDRVVRMGTDGLGRVWLLHADGVSYPDENQRGPAILYKLPRQPRYLTDTFMDADGRHGLILSILDGYIAASSAQTGRLLRLYPLAFPASSLLVMDILDKQRFYVAGREGVQIFDIDQALRADPIATDYQRLLDDERKRISALNPA